MMQCFEKYETKPSPSKPKSWVSWSIYEIVYEITFLDELLAYSLWNTIIKQPFPVSSEHLIKSMADRMASEGYRDVGYEYVIIDDCWLASERDQNGRLVPDPNRFPSGIKNLSDYVR